VPGRVERAATAALIHDRAAWVPFERVSVSIATNVKFHQQRRAYAKNLQRSVTYGILRKRPIVTRVGLLLDYPEQSAL
jgi:hypothetical protein